MPTAAGIGGYAQSKGGQNGTDVRLIQVSAHAGHIAYVIAHVVGDGGGVAGVIFGDTGLHLTDEVGAHIGGFGEDTAAHAGEQSHEGGAHAEHDHGLGNLGGVIVGNVLQNVEPNGDIQQAQAHHGEAHDGAGGEGHFQAFVQALASGLRGAGVGVGGNLHAHKASQGGVDAAGEEGKGDEPVVQQLAELQNQKNYEYDQKDFQNGGVLVFQVGIGTFLDRRCDLFHGVIAFGERQYLAALDNSEHDGQDRAHYAKPK